MFRWVFPALCFLYLVLVMSSFPTDPIFGPGNLGKCDWCYRLTVNNAKPLYFSPLSRSFFILFILFESAQIMHADPGHEAALDWKRNEGDTLRYSCPGVDYSCAEHNL